MNKIRSFVAMVCVVASSPYISQAQTAIAPAFAASYSLFDLGAAPGVPAPYGGLTLKFDDPNTLLLGGAANGGNGAVYAIGVVRDANSHIIAFTGTATLFATAPNIDGGLAYGPNDVLFFTGYPNNTLGEIKVGSVSPDKIINLSGLGIVSSVGSVLFAPAPPPPTGTNGVPVTSNLIRILSYNGGGFYSGNLSSDGSGTFDLSGVNLRSTTGFGPEGAIYAPGSAPVFTGASMLISEYSAGRVSAYSLDTNGAPIPSSRQDFITGLGGAEGAFTDPLTQDFLFSTFGGGNHVIVVHGFVVQPCTPPPSGMVGWYPGDGNANDISSTGNNGTLQGGATYGAGIVGQAFSLNGSDAFVQAPANTAQDPTSAGSQDAWVFFNQLPSAAGHIMEIIGKGSSGRDFDLQAEQDNHFHFYISGGVQVASTTTIQTGVWYYVAGTWDATGLRIYLNGVLENTNAAQNVTRLQSGQPLQIGNQPFFGPRLFNGRIDEAEIFNRRLTDDEVAAINNSRTSGKCRTCTTPPSGMTEWYPFDVDGRDTRNGNNATLFGFATITTGYVSNALQLNGSSGTYARANASPTLDVGAAANSGLSVDAWIRPFDLTSGRPIVEWSANADTPGSIGVHLYASTGGQGNLYANLRTGSTDHIIQTGPGVITANTYQHVALTYNKESGVANLYLNGTVVATATVGAFNPNTTGDLYFGARVSNEANDVGYRYNGQIDEVEIFNRELSLAEIAAIVNAGNAGKCKIICPTITLGSLPNGTVGVAYSGSVAASPSGSYTYAVTTGALPPGLTLNASTGAVTGTPTTTNGSPFSFSITATDGNGCSGSQNYSVTINCPAITVSPSSLPGGTVNSPYSQTLTASGTSNSFTFGVTSGSLPDGLTLSSSGTLSGTPTVAGSFTFTVTATDATAGCSGSREYTIVIVCPTITLGSLPNGTVGAAYSGSAAASPAGTYTYSVSMGSLPPGLSLNTSTGAVTGTPTTSTGSPFNFTITAAVSNCSGSRSYSVTISCPTTTVSPTTLPDGTVSTPYNQTVTASGTGGTYTFSVSGGTLPNGLMLSTSGQLTGTPTTQGMFTFTIMATDTSAGCSGSRQYTVTINPATCPTITLSPSTLPNGTVGTAYNQTVSASGGSGSYTYSVSSGALPPGLMLNASTGQISGTPTTSNGSPFSFTITATDGSGCTGGRAYMVTVGCPTTTVSPTTLPDGTVGTPYNQTITAAGTGGTYTFSVSGGTLPNGLMLSTSGQLTGTPTTQGMFTFTITATDTSAGCSGSRQYTVTINPASTGQCSVCHKGRTITLQCSSLEYQRHLDHGDPPNACTP